MLLQFGRLEILLNIFNAGMVVLWEDVTKELSEGDISVPASLMISMLQQDR